LLIGHDDTDWVEEGRKEGFGVVVEGFVTTVRCTVVRVRVASADVAIKPNREGKGGRAA